jgi:hypothetical protein
MYSLTEEGRPLLHAVLEEKVISWVASHSRCRASYQG